MSEELAQVLEAFSSLGESGVNAFIIWIAVSYLKTLTVAASMVFIATFLIRRVGVALCNLAKVKAND